jgi:hypothetical protein
VFIKDTDNAYGTLIIDAVSGGNGSTPLGLPGQSSATFADPVVIRGSGTHVRPEHAGMNLVFQNSLSVSGSSQFTTDATLMVSGSVAVTVAGMLTASQELDVDGSMTIDGAITAGGRIVAPALSVTNGGVLTSLSATTTSVYSLELQVAGTLSVDATSKIDVSGRGYLWGRTTGNTPLDPATVHSGGSYGGSGGQNGLLVAPYGDYADPNDWGSGSGPNSGGIGGGLVRITAGALTLDGQLLANGGTLGGSSGSGGGIYVAVTTLSGTGQITAAGGGTNLTAGYCGGGGGRVAIYAADFTGFNLAAIAAPGGTAAAGYLGGPGTVFIKDTDNTYGTLIIDAVSDGHGSTPLGLPGQSSTTFADPVVIRGSGTHVRPEHAGMNLVFQNSLSVSGSSQFTADATLTVSGSVAVTAGGVLTATQELDVSGTVTVDAAVVAGGRIVAPALSVTNGGVLTYVWGDPT